MTKKKTTRKVKKIQFPFYIVYNPKRRGEESWNSYTDGYQTLEAAKAACLDGWEIYRVDGAELLGTIIYTFKD